MPMFGIPTGEEKDNLSTQLTFLYLEKADISSLTPKEFAEKYFEIKQQIYDVVEPKEHL